MCLLIRYAGRTLTALSGFAVFVAMIFLDSASADETASSQVLFGFGRPATSAEIAAWDIDVRPDGKGLPQGSGTAVEGAKIYATKCVACHGVDGSGGINDRLVVHSPAESFPDAARADTWQHRTIGNYWPYATTLFDYIRRSMPANLPGSLNNDEVYALTAHLLHLNHIVAGDAEMNAETLPRVEMPAKNNFVPDDRQEYREVH